MSQVAMHCPSGMVAKNLSNVQPSVPVPINPYRTGLPTLWAVSIPGAPRPVSEEAAANEAAVLRNSRRETSCSFSIIKTPYDSRAQSKCQGGILRRHTSPVGIIALNTPNLTYDKLSTPSGGVSITPQFHIVKYDHPCYPTRSATAGEPTPAIAISGKHPAVQNLHLGYTGQGGYSDALKVLAPILRTALLAAPFFLIAPGLYPQTSS